MLARQYEDKKQLANMATPDISSGSFFIKDVQNFTDMSFDQLNQAEATNFLY